MKNEDLPSRVHFRAESQALRRLGTYWDVIRNNHGMKAWLAECQAGKALRAQGYDWQCITEAVFYLLHRGMLPPKPEWRLLPTFLVAWLADGGISEVFPYLQAERIKARMEELRLGIAGQLEELGELEEVLADEEERLQAREEGKSTALTETAKGSGRPGAEIVPIRRLNAK